MLRATKSTSELAQRKVMWRARCDQQTMQVNVKIEKYAMRYDFAKEMEVKHTRQRAELEEINKAERL